MVCKSVGYRYRTRGNSDACLAPGQPIRAGEQSFSSLLFRAMGSNCFYDISCFPICTCSLGDQNLNHGWVDEDYQILLMTTKRMQVGYWVSLLLFLLVHIGCDDVATLVMKLSNPIMAELFPLLLWGIHVICAQIWIFLLVVSLRCVTNFLSYSVLPVDQGKTISSNKSCQ